MWLCIMEDSLNIDFFNIVQGMVTACRGDSSKGHPAADCRGLGLGHLRTRMLDGPTSARAIQEHPPKHH